MKEKDREYLRHCFLRMLTEGNHSLSEEELNIWGTNLSVSLKNNSWFCIVITNDGVSYDGITVTRLLKQSQKALADCALTGYAMVGSNMNVLLLLPDLGDQHRQIIKKLNRILSQRTEYPIRLGIGRSYQNLMQLHCSREEAYEALSWGGNQMAVADIRDAGRSMAVSDAAVQNSRKRILESYRIGELNHLQQNLEELAELVRAGTVVRPDAPYPTSIRRTMVELLVEMMHIASDAGVDVDARIGNVDPYRKIFELFGTPAIIQWVVEIAHLLRQAMQERQKQLEISVLDQVKHHIQTHLSDMELNLSTVCETVGMSPSYLSAFFIREAGVGFKEYVTQQRILLAQQLLLESKDSINLISERCGFLSPSYFISVFKNQTGMTPGAYRKMKN